VFRLQDEDIERAVQQEMVNLRHPVVHVEPQIVNDAVLREAMKWKSRPTPALP
jgi:hypothetical protein